MNAGGESAGKGSKSSQRRVKWQRVLLAVGLLAVLVVGYWWLYQRHRVTTDDAYVMADSARISSRVKGCVQRVLVENDQPVRVGQPLVELDPRDHQVEVERSRALLERIDAQIRAAQLTVPLTDTLTDSQVQAAEAQVQASQDRLREVRHQVEQLQQKRLAALAEHGHTARDLERYEALYLEGAGSAQQRDRASTAQKKARAQLDATVAEISAQEALLEAVRQETDRARANYQASVGDRRRVEIESHRLDALKAERSEIQARLLAAQLNLSYCTVAAPIQGYISQKSVQVGESIEPGQPLMAVVPLQDVYVEANYKETQLKNVRLGQPATIHADIYPGHQYRGRVVGIRAGTGAAFSLLPPENATGNWIKVVQRVPVKIELESLPPRDRPLRVGLSLEVTIDIHDRGGQTLVAESASAR